MKLLPLRFLITVVAASSSLWAQAPIPSSAASDGGRGFTEIESIQGTLGSDAKLVKLDSTIGYDFNKHFGIFTGIPIYFTNFPSTTTTPGGPTGSTSGTGTGIGDFYAGFAFRAPNPVLNYASSVTAGAPTGSTKNGLSTGRGTLDWSNHFDHSFGRLTPFLDVGLGNTVPDSSRIIRAFTSMGTVGHFEEGAEFELLHHFAVGGSGYEIVPWGNQKIISRQVRKGQIISGSGLTREDGASSWLAFEPNRLVRAELGFTRSLTFDSNSATLNLGLNVGNLLRSKNRQ